MDILLQLCPEESGLGLGSGDLDPINSQMELSRVRSQQGVVAEEHEVLGRARRSNSPAPVVDLQAFESLCHFCIREMARYERSNAKGRQNASPT